MADPIIPLTDDELKALAPQLAKDPAMLNKLTSEERRRLTQFQAPPPEDPTANSSAPVRFMAGVAQNLNPVPFANALREQGPLQVGKQMLAAQGQQFQQAGEDFKQGRYSEALGHTTAGVLPIVGPAAAQAGETIASGNVAGGLGQGVALAAPFLVGPLEEGARAVGDATGIGDRIATTADRMATNRFTDATAPKIGQNKVRINNVAANIAPDILRNTTSITPSGLRAEVASKFDAAGAALDAAADARGANATMPTGPTLSALQDARRRLVAESVKPSPLDPTQSGTDVVPAPNQGQVALIDKAIAEVKQLGPTARYESLRRIRQAYDQIANVKYSPAVTPDFLAKQGDATAASAVTGALRQSLAVESPETAAANADYSLYKSANDVMQATEETERARPTVGRTIMARVLGAAAGGAEGGVVGAGIGAMVGPLLEKLAGDAKPALKLIMARRLSELADAMRGNQTARVQSLTSKIVHQFPELAAGTPKPASLGVALPMAAGGPTPSPDQSAQQ